MLKIGEFAWLGQVTVETLRHYDRLGLLKPDHLDPFTDYRYYTLGQLPQLNRILALKDLGLSLEDIARMLDNNIEADTIRHILLAQQAELTRQVQASQQRLARVEVRLKQIDQEGKMPEYEVLLKAVEAQWIASVRQTLSSWEQEDFGPTVSGMFAQVGEYLNRQDIKPVGPGMALYHADRLVENSSQRGEPDIETALPTARPVPDSDLITIRQMPKTQVAYAVHRGSFTGLLAAKQAIVAWVEANGYQCTGPFCEVYLHFDDDHQANQDSPYHVIEIQLPVTKA
ncbi:MAG TPA: MerR family transcriptional regulator [Aggregatilinea sp.]|uniref:MerR family transcriptional regulator n=1 Tax=Aggregatilinea sp. TaxID=2806333 RepID=UPI002B995770|nr:MerR family transcriptional regulator [Aggregatilinea sp.]HML25033.1 MerR family transcriptional regulator [Aggregatilinea sp.]